MTDMILQKTLIALFESIARFGCGLEGLCYEIETTNARKE
jgi:hypothetical protein